MVPARLLDLSAPPEFTQAISEGNKNRSPLLALPSEILNKILRNVVADQKIHVLPEGSRKYKTRICASPEDCPTSESPRIHLARDIYVSDGMEDDSCFTLRHKECANNVITKSGLNLDVLLTCRQIYREASLLPFQRNTFVFGLHAPIEGPVPTMAGFLNRLKREQREAVRHVVIASGSIESGTLKSQLAQLRGLRSLHMLIAPGCDVDDFLWALRNCLSFAILYRMDWLPLETFRISMEAYLDRRALDALSFQAPELDRLARYLEAVFLFLNSNLTDEKTALRAAGAFLEAVVLLESRGGDSSHNSNLAKVKTALLEAVALLKSKNLQCFQDKDTGDLSYHSNLAEAQSALLKAKKELIEDGSGFFESRVVKLDRKLRGLLT